MSWNSYVVKFIYSIVKFIYREIHISWNLIHISYRWRVVSDDLRSSGMIPASKFAYRKGLGPCEYCDALLCVFHALQSSSLKSICMILAICPRWLRSYRLISALLIGSTNSEFSISSALYRAGSILYIGYREYSLYWIIPIFSILEVLCYLYWHSF